MKNNKIINLSEVIERIFELQKEYCELEVDWKKDKSFKKLDRKHEIETVFKNLNIFLEPWK